MDFVKTIDFEFEPIKIANITAGGTLVMQVSRFIGEYQKKCLIELLGQCLYDELVSSFDFVDGAYVLKTDAPQNIKDLVNGKEYEKPESTTTSIETLWFWVYFGFANRGCGCGCNESTCTKRVWKGLREEFQYVYGNSVSTYGRSLIAYYIYYNYLLKHRSESTGTGQTVLGSENGQTVQNYSKRIETWNEFVNQVYGANGMVGLYQYLCDNATDYPTWKPSCNIRYKDLL